MCRVRYDVGVMQQIVVDGYNVIHAGGSEAGPGRSLEAGRDDLLARITSYVAARRVRVTVVFDGAGGMIDADVVVPGKLQVLYSRTGQTADELIVDMLERHTNPREYIVVTNDMADIGRRARAMGASVMRSQDFLRRIDKRESVGDAGKRGDKPRTDANDVDYWLEQFGDRNDNDDVDK